MTEQNTEEPNIKELLENVAKLQADIIARRETKAVEPILNNPTKDPLEEEKAKIEQENAIRKEIEENILFQKSIESFNEDWSKVAQLYTDVSSEMNTIDKLNASNEYKLAKKLEAIFSKEDNQNILSKDILNKFNSFQGLQEDDKHKNIKNLSIDLKNNFFENLEKLEIQKARLMQQGVIKDQNQPVIKDPIISRTINNSKIKAIA